MASLVLSLILTLALADSASAQGAALPQSGALQATLSEPNQKTPEVSTEDLRRILSDGSAIVLDSRKSSEYAAGHIPGARNLALGADASAAQTLAAVEKLLGGDKTKALVLYCNGQFCQASRRLSDQLVAAGFTNVRRYQLGIPMWRALGGVTEIELDGIRRVYNVDRTAVFLDARTPEEFKAGSLSGAGNIPLRAVQADGLQKAGGELLPTDDFNTRVVVFGRDAAQARALAEAIAQNARHNVAYFPGTFDALRMAIK